MNRYLMLLGVAIVAFSIAGGAIALSSSYSEYRSHTQGSGAPLTALDEARWQIARLIGGGTIVGGTIAGSILMGLAWIGRTMEQVRDVLQNELVAPPSKAEEAITKRAN